MCLWCCWKDLAKQDFYGICLVRFGFRMWEILILKWFLPLRIQINSKKPGGRRVQDVGTSIKGGHYPSPFPNFQRVWASTTEDFFHFRRSALSCAWQWSAISLQKLGASFFGTRTTQEKNSMILDYMVPRSCCQQAYIQWPMFLQIIKCDQNGWSIKNSSKVSFVISMTFPDRISL